MMNNIGIYIHIPFCKSKCAYCNFVSGKFCQKFQKEYVKTLLEEIKIYKINKKISSIFFGGGTPSILPSSEINKILNCIKNNFKLTKNVEISIECNPNSVNFNKLFNYFKLGFNRISFGVQSLDDEVLNKIGRVHNRNQAIRAIKQAKMAGFNNINVDLLLGIKENKNIFKEIELLKSLGVTHISAYMLILEKETPLYKMVNEDKIKLLNEEQSIQEYEKYLKILNNFGFKRYEISNFCLKGFECKHNLNYWQCGEYVGFGVASHSYLDGIRYSNTENICEYVNDHNLKTYEKLSNKEKLEELIMLGLRTKKGVPLKNLLKYNYDPLKNKNALKMLCLKLIKINKTHLYITSKNFGITNQIILKLIED